MTLPVQATSLDVRPIDALLDALARGQPVVLTALEDAALVLPAAEAPTAALAFVIRHSSGLVGVALPGDRCDALELPPMRPSFRHDDQRGWCVAVDAANGVATGISATDRAETIRRLAHRDTRPEDLNRPGHVLPYATRPDGVFGVPEASVELCLRAGLPAAAAFAALVSPEDPTRMATPGEAAAFAATHGLPLLDSAAAGRSGIPRDASCRALSAAGSGERHPT
ncbi:3,4-dihydroxy-2-butanone-4-phosphate synthase [Amycolatopsis sp. FU40]|uniref:3,4-dihydroxy-2-butanone-4-phosphate synthase n=1 Tax=Amycolatopsis sp. FU40 TaxID=2914159 RepID=UPI001F16E601|nr:3,4-dihydroxy-2-butanone-4-phosphate synthase [Amycolatopsis sp. FU40]UKD56815.1 3,4-dihydroxy-2-butanone-4-phosphate synthase [Amycolatopsis sp. FU40]